MTHTTPLTEYRVAPYAVEDGVVLEYAAMAFRGGDAVTGEVRGATMLLAAMACLRAVSSMDAAEIERRAKRG